MRTGRSSAPAGTGQQFAARKSGATAGVVTEGGQSVFASSSASKAKKAAGAGAPSPSERSASSDAWSGFSSQSSAARGSSAPVAALGEDGSGSTLGVTILGLGLIGVLGSFLLLAVSRRRRVLVDSEGTSRPGRGPSPR